MFAERCKELCQMVNLPLSRITISVVVYLVQEVYVCLAPSAMIKGESRKKVEKRKQCLTKWMD